MQTLRIGRIRTQHTGLRVHEPIATPRLRGDTWQKVRLEWFRLHPLCVSCEAKGFVVQADELDHIVPLFKGGLDTASNYQSLCVPCHKQKTREDRKI